MVLVFCCVIPIWGQQIQNDSISKNNLIPLPEITFKYDELQIQIEEILISARINKDVIKIDSNYGKFESKIDSLGIKILSDTVRLSTSRIGNLQKEWNNYSNKLLNWKLEIAEHTRKVETFIDTLELKLMLWENTYHKLNQKEVPNEINQRINSAIDSINLANKKLSNIDNWLLLAQDKMISTQSKVKNVLDYLDQQESSYRGSLFIIDSNPIWNWNTQEKSSTIWQELTTSYSDQKRILLLFIEDYSWQFLFHFLVFIGLLWFFYFLKRRYLHTDFPGDDNRIILAKTTIQHAFISSIILGFMISIYYYRAAPGVVATILTILVSFPVIILFPKYINIKSRKFLYAVLGVYFLQEIQELIIVDHLMNRFIQLLKAGILIYILNIAYRNQNAKQHGFGNTYWKAIIKYFGPVFLLIAIASVLANIIGAYQLSEVLITGVINASTYAIIFMIYGVILASVFIILLRSKFSSSLQKFTKDNAKFELRISGLIYLYMFYLWGRSTLVGFKLLNPIIDFYQEFIALFWIIGGVKISVGGILSFLVILVVTFILAKLIRELINDNVIPVNTNSRGLPNAFSMVIRYMIVTLGVYIALSAAGINLSEFGLVAGALGVGLGFGLQNILHNLVSGLIVSFERPIHVGDTVQVDQLHGVVTEIGVRSSKIKTFDGSEVILPNGDLLSKQVINWTLTDQKRRLEIKVKTSFDANPREVIELLKKEVVHHKNVLHNPDPLFLFEGFGDSALHFRVLFWVYYNVGLSTKSEVALAIYDKLKEKKIEAPIPQQRLLYLDTPKKEDKPI